MSDDYEQVLQKKSVACPIRAFTNAFGARNTKHHYIEMGNKTSHKKNCPRKFCGKRAPAPRLEERRKCRVCRKEMSRTHRCEHEKYHCAKNPSRRHRTYSRVKCPVCEQMIHAKYLATHVHEQHG